MSDEILNDYIDRLRSAGHLPKTAESKELTKYKDEVYPRMDSQSIKVIEKLYKVKPEMTVKYEDNIMEAAHPEPLVMFQADDKINALVENENERQKINLNILRRPVSGLEYRRKYAIELMQTLVAIANDMDFQDNEPLRKLADNTITHFQKEAGWLDDAGEWIKNKLTDAKDIGGGAVSGTAIGAIAGGLIGAFGGPEGILAGAWAGSKVGGALGGIGGGVLSAIFKTGPLARNVQSNAKTAQSKLDSLIKDHPGDIFLTSLSTALTHIQQTAGTYSSLVDQMHQGSQSDAALAEKTGQEYIREIGTLDRMIDVFLANARAGKYVSNSSDWVEKLESPFKGIFGDALHDTIESMEVLETVSHEARDSIIGTKQLVASATQELAAQSQNEPDLMDPKMLQSVLNQFNNSER